MPEAITSFQNPRVKQIKRLRDKKSRIEERRFLIDDVRDLTRALAQGYTIDYALACPALLKPDEEAIFNQLHPSRQFNIPNDVMEKISYRDNPAGMVTVMQSIPPKGATDLAHITSSQILVLVNLQKPGNIGALMRTADATGFTPVLLVDTALDMYNPNIIRSSTGACFLGNIYTLTSEEALTFLKTQGYRIISAVVDGDTSLYHVDFKHKCAVVLGTEDQGLPPLWMQSADVRTRIPMLGQLTDSFNVSVSGAIFMMEALRQTHF